MQLWIISGARRGVGKTVLAKRLGAVLPDSVYAKLGHGRARRDKSVNYCRNAEELEDFVRRSRSRCKHMVVESNSYSLGSQPGIRVFIDAVAGEADLREDAEELRRRADIEVSAADDGSGWRRVLKRRLRDQRLAEAVCGILAEQRRRLSRHQLAVRSKVWLINEQDEHVFGSGLADLIEDVGHLGSLRAAAQRANMSYRHAWGAIQDAERNLGLKLLARSTGGAGGGGSQLTPAAKRVLGLFRRVSERAAASADTEFAVGYGEDWGAHDD